MTSRCGTAPPSAEENFFQPNESFSFSAFNPIEPVPTPRSDQNWIRFDTGVPTQFGAQAPL